MNSVIFDLDGTLLDTMEDIRSAINYALKAFECSGISGDECRHFVGHGLRNALVQAAVSKHADIRCDEELELMYSLMMGYYRNHPADYAVPYKGVPELLVSLVGEGIKVGILSNKRDELVKVIVKEKFPDIPFAIVKGQTDGVPLKPDKAAFDYVLSRINADKRDVVYIGDSEVDAVTADNAGVARLIVSYGFRREEELRAIGLNPIPHVPSAEEIIKANDDYWKNLNCPI